MTAFGVAKQSFFAGTVITPASQRRPDASTQVVDGYNILVEINKVLIGPGF